MKDQPVQYRPACATDVAKTFRRFGFVPPSTLGHHKAIREQLNYIGFDEEHDQYSTQQKETSQ